MARPESSVLGTRTSHANVESVRGDENRGRVSLLDYSHLYKLRIVALATSLFTARATARLAIHQFTAKNSCRRTDRPIWRTAPPRAITLTSTTSFKGDGRAEYDGPMFDVFNLGEPNDSIEGFNRGDRDRLGKKAKINRLRSNQATCADLR